MIPFWLSEAHEWSKLGQIMDMHFFRRILALSPHTDDVEFGCGATLVKLRESGAWIKSVAFSAAEESVPAGLPINVLRQEFELAHDVLGIPAIDREVLDFKVRYFPRDRQDILEKLVWYYRDFKPDLVLVPGSADTHQDHKTVAEEAFRAFKKTSIWAYDIPWNERSSSLNCFVHISEQQVALKIEALAKYRSQKDRGYATETFIRALAVIRGGQAGLPLAEAFEIVRQIYPPA